MAGLAVAPRTNLSALLDILARPQFANAGLTAREIAEILVEENLVLWAPTGLYPVPTPQFPFVIRASGAANGNFRFLVAVIASQLGVNSRRPDPRVFCVRVGHTCRFVRI